MDNSVLIRTFQEDPSTGSKNYPKYATADDFINAMETVPAVKKTFREIIGSGIKQKLHFRYTIVSGQDDPTSQVVEAIKKVVKSLWSVKLDESQFIITKYTIKSESYFEIVIAGYYVSCSREAQYVASRVKAEVKVVNFDASAYKTDAEWICIESYMPFKNGNSKEFLNHAETNSRHLKIASLVTWINGCTFLDDKALKNKHVYNPDPSASTAQLEAPTSPRPDTDGLVNLQSGDQFTPLEGVEGDEQSEEQCSCADQEEDQQEYVPGSEEVSSPRSEEVVSPRKGKKGGKKSIPGKVKTLLFGEARLKKLDGTEVTDVLVR